MKKYQKISLFILAYLLSMMNVSSYSDHVHDTTERLWGEIKKNQTELRMLPIVIKHQEQDSIAQYESNSKDYAELVKKQQEKLDLQIKITQIAEQCCQDYWVKNFPKYKSYINSKFSRQDKLALSKCVNKAYFSLSPGVDVNFYTSSDQILYGPYWREFVEFVDSNAVDFSKVAKIIKKYETVRTDAEKRFPYIYPRSVFFMGQKITVNAEKPDTLNVIFTHAVQNGLDTLREQFRENNPKPEIEDFNKLCNVSDIFTVDLHNFLESVYMPNIFPETAEYLDLNNPLFKKHYDEIKELVKKIKVLNPRIAKLNIKHDKEIEKIQTHFNGVKEQYQVTGLERDRELRDSLEMVTRDL